MPDAVDLSDLVDDEPKRGTATRSTLGERVPAPPPPPRDALIKSAREAAGRYGIPPDWFVSLIDKGENGFNHPSATSPKGAKGVTQLMDDTAAAEGVDNPYDFEQNIDGGAKYAAELYKKFGGDIAKATAAYNAGPGAVQKYDGTPPYRETEDYVDRVLADNKRKGIAGENDTPAADAPAPSAVDLSDLMDTAPAKPVKRTPLQEAAHQAKQAVTPVLNAPADIGHRFMQGDREAAAAITPHNPFNPSPGPHPAAVPRLMEGLADMASAPFTGALDALVGRPASNILKDVTGGKLNVNPEAISDVLSTAIPVVGALGEARELSQAAKLGGVGERAILANSEARAALPKPNTLKAKVQPKGPQNEHQAAVARLRADGVEPAAHQAAGGLPQRIAESAKSDPYVGEGVRQAEHAANESFNRALYNKVLKPIGVSVSDNTPVDRNSIGKIQDKLSQAYDEVLPHVRVVGDKALTDQFADIRTSVAKLGKPQEQQFEAILNQDVLHHFDENGMDGKTFKSVESDLLRQSRNLKGSPDPNARGLGHALDDVLDALREDMVDHSPAEYRAKLKGINKSYAMFTRLQDAAARRQGGGGVITPGDLLAAVKKGDRTVRKGSFARGDALLQSFAEDADRVLTPKVRDSGTPERQATNRLLSGRGHIGAMLGGIGGAAHGGVEGGAMGAALGAGLDMVAARGTNALARTMLQRGPPRVTPRNYLKAANQRALAAPAAVTVSVPSLGISGNSNGAGQ